jgi:hypothetical protein
LEYCVNLLFDLDPEMSFDFIQQDDSEFVAPTRSQSLMSHSTVWSSSASSATSALSITPLRGKCLYLFVLVQSCFIFIYFFCILYFICFIVCSVFNLLCLFVGLSSPILSDSQFSVLNRSLTGRLSSLDDDLAELEVEEIDFFSNPVPVINGLFL